MKSEKKSLIFLLLSFLILINFSLTENSNDEDLIDISSGYTHVDPKDKIYFYIAVLSTNDVHGHFYPDEFEIKGYNYSQGGFDYLAKYINILRNEYPKRLLYLDAGDLFKGGTESVFSNGEIMTESLNLMECQAATFGDHEFDYSREFLEDKVNKATFPYLSTNIYDTKKKTKQAFGPNQLTSQVYKFNVTNIYRSKRENDDLNNLPDVINVGIIGLTKEMKKDEIKGEGYEDITFLNYKDELILEAKRLREEEDCLAVLLLTHLGISCGTEKTMELNMYKSQTPQDLCNNEDELYQLIVSLDKNTIDGVITGHKHQQVHHWVNGVPIMSSIDQGFYANIMYIPFKWSAAEQKYELTKSKLQIEGPIPICDQIFNVTQKCDVAKPSQIEEILPLVNYKFHGVKIEKDGVLNATHEKYDEQYENYTEKICDIVGIEEPIRISDNGDFYIGNIITEVQRRMTGADMSLIGYDFMKTKWNPGKLPKYKIYEVIPFANNLCTFVMKGNEIKKMMSILQINDKKYYPTSGIKQTMSKNEKGQYYLSDIKLFNGYEESEIIAEREYLVSTIEYLIKDGGSDFNKILKWYTPQDLNCEYGDIRDLVEIYLKAQNIVDVTKYKDIKNPKIKFID